MEPAPPQFRLPESPFEIELARTKIFTRLTLKELLACRQVNREWLHMVAPYLKNVAPPIEIYCESMNQYQKQMCWLTQCFIDSNWLHGKTFEWPFTKINLCINVHPEHISELEFQFDNFWSFVGPQITELKATILSYELDTKSQLVVFPRNEATFPKLEKLHVQCSTKLCKDKAFVQNLLEYLTKDGLNLQQLICDFGCSSLTWEIVGLIKVLEKLDQSKLSRLTLINADFENHWRALINLELKLKYLNLQHCNDLTSSLFSGWLNSSLAATLETLVISSDDTNLLVGVTLPNLKCLHLSLPMEKVANATQSTVINYNQQFPKLRILKFDICRVERAVHYFTFAGEPVPSLRELIVSVSPSDPFPDAEDDNEEERENPRFAIETLPRLFPKVSKLTVNAGDEGVKWIELVDAFPEVEELTLRLQTRCGAAVEDECTGARCISLDICLTNLSAETVNQFKDYSEMQWEREIETHRNRMELQPWTGLQKIKVLKIFGETYISYFITDVVCRLVFFQMANLQRLDFRTEKKIRECNSCCKLNVSDPVMQQLRQNYFVQTD